MGFHIGCDPEIFLKNAQEGLVASCNLIGGTKYHPRPLDGLPHGYAVQEDNVAIEFNIPPADSRETFISNINTAMTYLMDEIAQMGLHFATESAAIYPLDQLLDPKALEFGCEPDFDAWAHGKVNPKPAAQNKNLRSAGGHVHIGTIINSEKECHELIKLMDLYLAVPAALMDQGIMRKELYGKAGAFRYKPYGTEYRVLSNFWVFDSVLVDWVYRSTELAMAAWQNNMNIDSDKELILSAINNNDQGVAKHLINKYNLLVV